MSDALRRARRAREQQAAHAIGRDPRLPAWMAGHLDREGELARVIMGAVAESVTMYDEASASGTYGRLYFVPGISVPGGPDLVR